MSRKKQLRAIKLYQQALELEKSGALDQAIQYYQKATVTEPSLANAWNRLMILYRKTRTKLQEAKLIHNAITAYQKALESKQQDWLKTNQSKADDTRELADLLGMIEHTGLPKSGDTTIEKWHTRLCLLEYRIKNARKKKPNPQKTKTSKTTSK